MTERVLIVDFGSQVTQLIARRVRESGVYCEIHPFNRVTDAWLAKFEPKAVILSGGPASVTEAATPRLADGAFALGVPVLGICYGQQAMVAQLGGQVEVADHREFGRAFVDVVEDCALFTGVWRKGDHAEVWMSHGDRVVALPEGFRAVAVSDGSPFAVIADEARRYYGLTFHPEVAHTPQGAALLENFTHRVAGCPADWTMAAFRDHAVAEARARIGKGRVVCGLSGGVDSSVVAVLLHEAVGAQLVCVFVDTGLLRLGEAEDVVSLFRGHYNIPLVMRDASALFLDRLAGVSEPEKKRSVIGATFIEVFEDEAAKAGGAEFLGPGDTLSRRHRIGVDRGRTFGHDQVPSQRGRPARTHEPRPCRAPARAVQGRGAPPRARAGSAGAPDRPPPLPRGPDSPSASPAR